MAKHIKDLKDLRALRTAECYRHSGPTDLKRRFFPSANDGEGQALALRCGGAFFIVARGPVPRDRWSARAMASLLHRDREVSPTGMPYKLGLGRREEGLK